MRSRTIAAAFLTLLSSHALAYDATKAPRYASPDMYRPNVDRLIINGPGSTGPIDQMSISGLPLNSGVVTSVLTRLTPSQVADVRSGNATLDLSAVLNSAFNSACMPGLPVPTFTFPAGIYGIKAQLLASTCPINIVLESGAFLKQTAAFATQPNVPQAVISITGNAKGSSITGPGTIDGNRAALIGAYSALPTIPVYGGTRVTGHEQDCVLAQYVDDVTISGITLQGCLSNAFNITGTNRVRVSDIKVKDTTKVASLQTNDQFIFENILASNIGNSVNGTPIPIFNYGIETRDLTHFRIANIRINGYAPIQYMGPGTTNGIGDPKPGAFHGESLSNGTIDDVQIDGYTYADSRAVNSSWGGHLSGLTDVSVRSFKAKGFFSPLEIDGSIRVTLDGFTLDCNWNTAGGESIGLLMRGSGMAPKNIASPQDHWSNQPSYDLTISNGTATRCTKGSIVASGNILINGVRFNGNAVNGLQLWSTLSNNSTFPNVVPPYIGRVTVANSEARFNGQAGVQINDGIGVSLPGLHASNNGQEQVGGFGAGVLLFSSGMKDRITLSGWSAGDDQSFTLPKNASFIPGSTDSNNRFSVVMASSERLAVGQRVLIKNGTGSADINAKILDITNDVHTLQASGSVTFSETGNLTTLAGTVSLTAGSQTLSGSGTAFTTAITGPVYLKAGGQYVKVIRVNSDTSAVIETGAPASVSGASAQLVQANVAGIPSQNYGINAPAGQNIARFSFGPYGSYSAEGNVVASTTIGDFSSLVDGQEVLLEGGVVNASTTGGDTQLITPITMSPQVVALAYRAKIVSPYTFSSGSGQTLTLQMGSNTSSLTLPAFASNTAGAFLSGPVSNPSTTSGAWGWVAANTLYFTARASMTPTGGQIRGDLLVRKVGLQPFAN